MAKPPNVVVFADFSTICEAANVTVSEEEVSSPLHLCSEHYATYSYCRCVSECALFGSKSKHRAGNDKRVPLRLLLPQLGTIKVLLDEAGNFEKCLCGEHAIAAICFLRGCYSNVGRMYTLPRAL